MLSERRGKWFIIPHFARFTRTQSLRWIESIKVEKGEKDSHLVMKMVVAQEKPCSSFATLSHVKFYWNTITIWVNLVFLVRTIKLIQLNIKNTQNKYFVAIIFFYPPVKYSSAFKLQSVLIGKYRNVLRGKNTLDWDIFRRDGSDWPTGSSPTTNIKVRPVYCMLIMAMLGT